jgi:hypothetical protein
VVECLLYKCRALSSNPSLPPPHKKKIQEAGCATLLSYLAGVKSATGWALRGPAPTQPAPDPT